ncbi:CAIB/BAIF family enzyme [Panaeolus papilionaceus]|nr:CAIB/BAIF family enzyme [Panaeolus papilionaceus]
MSLFRIVPLAHCRNNSRLCIRTIPQWTRSYQSQPRSEPLAMPYGPGMDPPLKGIKVLDLTRVLAGPTATMLLADLGADVVKVEEVTRGDDTRSWMPPMAPTIESAPSTSSHLPPESAYFLAVNRNKRSMTVNFKEPEGLEIIHKLVQQSDVLVENFVSGKLASMGLGWEDCHKLNERLVYASITGYGQTGPYRTAAGYDVIIEGEAGLMHITGEPDRPPSKVGVAATDIATGLYAHGAIMAALISRSKTGKGVWIDCNLFESQIAGLANIASNYLIAGQEASRHGTAHPSIVPYQVFPCKDGFLMIGAGNNKQFKALSEKALNRPELADDARFATNEARVKNRTELVDIITNTLVQRDREYWLKQFTGLGVPFGPINNIEETFQHPQAIARQVTVEVEHERAGKIKLVAPAVSYNGRKMEVRLPPPWLSQHTNEVMEGLGYSSEQVKDLRSRGIV